MPEQQKIAKAELQELDAEFKDQINKDKATKVQFNPDSLKVTFANQIQQPQGGGDQGGTQAQQFVGAGSTKLVVMLWFDVTQELSADLPDTMDVRKLTQRVAYFITPKGDPPNKPKKYMPPAVRFLWGTFQFDGIVEGMEETLELFSAEGRPLRASVSLTITQQKITSFAFNEANAVQPAGFKRKPAGTSPQTPAPQNSNLQSMSAAQPGGSSANNSNTSGGGRDWQSVAAANGIENPRRLEPGQFIDFEATKPRILRD